MRKVQTSRVGESTKFAAASKQVQGFSDEWERYAELIKEIEQEATLTENCIDSLNMALKTAEQVSSDLTKSKKETRCKPSLTQMASSIISELKKREGAELFEVLLIYKHIFTIYRSVLMDNEVFSESHFMEDLAKLVAITHWLEQFDPMTYAEKNQFHFWKAVSDPRNLISDLDMIYSLGNAPQYHEYPRI